MSSALPWITWHGARLHVGPPPDAERVRSWVEAGLSLSIACMVRNRLGPAAARLELYEQANPDPRQLAQARIDVEAERAALEEFMPLPCDDAELPRASVVTRAHRESS